MSLKPRRMRFSKIEASRFNKLYKNSNKSFKIASKMLIVMETPLDLKNKNGIKITLYLTQLLT